MSGHAVSSDWENKNFQYVRELQIWYVLADHKVTDQSMKYLPPESHFKEFSKINYFNYLNFNVNWTSIQTCTMKKYWNTLNKHASLIILFVQAQNNFTELKR